MSNRRETLSNIQLEILDGKHPHAGLWLDRYLAETNESDKNSKHIREVSSIAIPEVYVTFYERWKEQLKTCGASMREAQVKGRMIVGLGSESVLETSIALHRTYGVPYIPGSALKGLVASYVRQKLGETWKKGTPAYKVLFGDTDEAGYITFFDAMYIPGPEVEGKTLHPDVITVHHPDYYGNASHAPADWDSPNPVSFLSATGKYLIALAALEFESGQEWVDITFDILKNALHTMGIGAKTSSGYGRMEFEIDLSSPDMKAALALQQQIENIPDAKVGSQIDPMFSRWSKLSSDNAKKMVGKAIIKKVQDAKVESSVGARGWYKVLQNFLNK